MATYADRVYARTSMTLDELTHELRKIDPNVEVHYTDTDPAWFTAYFSIVPTDEQLQVVTTIFPKE